MKHIILASASPRRSEILTKLGYEFKVFSPDVKEISTGQPNEIVAVNARAKAECCTAVYQNATVIAADTVVALEGKIFGKPADLLEAARMLSELSGKWHNVVTGVCISFPEGDRVEFAEETDVKFMKLSHSDIERLILLDDPLDKAGAYMLQGYAGMYVERIRGDYNNVVGLPAARLLRALRSRLG